MRRISRKGVSPKLLTTLTRIMQLIQLIIRLLPVPDPTDQQPTATPTPQPEPTATETPTPPAMETPMEVTQPEPTVKKTTTLSRIIGIIRGERNSHKGS